MKYSRWWAYIGVSLFSVGVLALAFYKSIPDVKALKGCLKTQMNSYYLCNKSPNYVVLEEISPHVVNAILVSEDGSFYFHNGFDWFEIKETIEKNLAKMNYSRGGSTITQQLAKNIFLSSEKSIFRKLREAVLTLQIEKNFSKDEILEKYLNVIEFGPNIYGVRAAAKHYFNKVPFDLDIIESAFLAFLLPNPKTYRESFVVKKLTPFARQRMAQIISRMARFRKITDDDELENLESLSESQWLNEPVIEEEEAVEVNEDPTAELED